MCDLPEGVYLRHPDHKGTRGNCEYQNAAIRDGLSVFEWDDYCGFGDKPDPQYFGVTSDDTIVHKVMVFQSTEDYARYAEAYVLPQEMLLGSAGSTGGLRRDAHQSRDQYD